MSLCNWISAIIAKKAKGWYIDLSVTEFDLNVAGSWGGEGTGASEGKATVRKKCNRKIWWKGGWM